MHVGVFLYSRPVSTGPDAVPEAFPEPGPSKLTATSSVCPDVQLASSLTSQTQVCDHSTVQASQANQAVNQANDIGILIHSGQTEHVSESEKYSILKGLGNWAPRPQRAISETAPQIKK